MKKIYVLILISLLSISMSAQTVFSDAFTADAPAPLLVVGDQMYVGTIFDGKLYRIDISDPNSPTVVSDLAADGIWKMIYDEQNNDIYIRSFGPPYFSKVDLDLSIPIESEMVLSTGAGISGIELSETIIYLTDGDSIYTYDIEIGASSFELLYTDAGNEIRNPRVYNNELYYGVGNVPNSNLYKIDLLDSDPQRVLVASNLPGLVQSSLVVGDYLYLGLEVLNNIVRLDLTSTLPITPEAVLENLSGGTLGLANQGNIFYASQGSNRTIITFESQALGINESNQNSLLIFPNPVENSLYIKGVNSTELFFSIYAINGTKLMEDTYEDIIDTSNLSKGLYFIELNENGIIQTEKFVKE